MPVLAETVETEPHSNLSASEEKNLKYSNDFNTFLFSLDCISPISVWNVHEIAHWLKLLFLLKKIQLEICKQFWMIIKKQCFLIQHLKTNKDSNNRKTKQMPS